MSKKKITRVLSTVLCGVMGLSTCASLASCKKTNTKRDSIVIMTEELSGLFNPFYATSGADMDVVGMTQIGMLSTDSDGQPVAGKEEPTVVLDFDKEPVYNASTNESVYTFVIKNGLKFSDGEPLTMEDVLFNMYEYLDPVYTGSSTMYSIDIKGLMKYRTQENYANDKDAEAAASKNNDKAVINATKRLLELKNVYTKNGLVANSQSSYSMTEAEMKEAISKWKVTSGYQTAVATDSEIKNMKNEDFQAMLLEDYELALKTHKEELEADFKAAKESYDLNTMPYKEWKKEMSSDIFKFFLYEGKITPEYEDVKGKKNKEKIVKFNNAEIVERYKTEAEAIQLIYNDNIKYKLHEVLSYWGTAGTLTTQFTADALDVLLRGQKKADGTLEFKNIEGIVSLGHMNNTSNTTKVEKVTLQNGKEYTVAHEHNADGTPKNANEYDVLQITVNGTDPKAIYNFGFSVAPAHYYTADAQHPNGREIDISNDKFGVEFASSDFQSRTIQSQQHVEVPVGAGAFKATNASNANNPAGSEFWQSSIVYFKANDNFMFPVQAKKLRMQVVSASNALDKLQNGEVDYVTPQFTKANSERLRTMKSKGFESLDSWQLGYGYIGINAGKIPNIHVRRAIMAAMNTELACTFYESGTCVPISWPMSRVSWAYPWEDKDKGKELKNDTPYTQWTDSEPTKEEAASKSLVELYPDAVKEIKDEMALARRKGATDADFKNIRFTIAGASITDHPTYAVFKLASELLNELGWEIEVKADSQALTKLSTGSLQVWAAAWGSTVDPDMYQVYHMNSSATSVYAWGYREIKSNPSQYKEELQIITDLSGIIDDARSKTDQAYRTAEYEKAMRKVLELAVELPVYQRKTLYAYNKNTIKGLTTNVNHYSSPLEKIWELALVK